MSDDLMLRLHRTPSTSTAIDLARGIARLAEVGLQYTRAARGPAAERRLTV
jgi:hypothetical protein